MRLSFRIPQQLNQSTQLITYPTNIKKQISAYFVKQKLIIFA